MITLQLCERCKRFKKHGEWVFPTQDELTQMREMYADGEVEFDYCICDHCLPQ